MAEINKRDVLNVYVKKEISISLENISDDKLELLSGSISDYLNNDSENMRDFI